MPALLLLAPEPLAGKTTLAAGLAQRLNDAGRSVGLVRLEGGEHAAHDATLFAGLPFNATRGPEPLALSALPELLKASETVLLEAGAGTSTDLLAAAKDAAALVVASPGSPEAVANYCRQLGRPAQLIVNRVPRRRLEATRRAFEAAGVPPLALLLEDRALASPTLAQVAEALEARARFLNAHAARLIDRPVIASISADPGQSYFAARRPDAVIVRGDKPDLQLAALNAGAPCLILTGGQQTLSYVLDRCEEDEIPLLETSLDTVAAVERIEEMFAAGPFTGGDKLRSAAELLADLDLTAVA